VTCLICYGPVAVLLAAWLLRVAGVAPHIVEVPFWPVFIVSVWLYIRATRRKIRDIHGRAGERANER
jgi:uncharacterized membrane-anchored protein